MILVNAETTRAELEEAIGHVRAKHAACEDAQVRAEIAADLDDLLDAWKVAKA